MSELDDKSIMLGAHSARLNALEQKVTEVAADVKTILAFMERSKGSWKVIVALGTIAGTVVGAVIEIAHWIGGRSAN